MRSVFILRTGAEAGVFGCAIAIAELEARYSRYRQQSLVSKLIVRLVLGEVLPLIKEALLDYADQLYHQSDGFLILLRGAPGVEFCSPASERQLSQLLPLIGWHQVERARGQLYLPKKGWNSIWWHRQRVRSG